MSPQARRPILLADRSTKGAGVRNTNQKLSKEDRAELDRFYGYLDSAQRAQAIQRRIWERDEKIYRGEDELPADIDDLLVSKLRVPWCWQQVQTIIPRVMDPEPRLVFLPVEASDDRVADLLNIIVRKQLNSMNWVLRQYKFVEDAMVRRLAVAKVTLYQNVELVRTRVPFTDEERAAINSGEKVERKWKEKEYVVETRPDIGWVPLEDYFGDPSATSDLDKRFDIQRLWFTYDELLQREKEGLYRDVKLVLRNSEDDQNVRDNENTVEAEARREGKYAVYEGWFRRGKRMIRTSVCDGVLLQTGPSPYAHNSSPFVTFNTQPNPRSLYGISEIENIRHLQQAVWVKDNQRIDAVNAALNFVVIHDPAVRDLKEGRIRPGLKIRAVQGQRIEQWQIGANAGLAFQETENYLAAMQQMTGATPLFAGADPGTIGIDNQTATGASIMQEEGNKRMAMKKLYFRLFEARIAKLMVQLNHQYLSETELQRMLGPEYGDWKPIAPEEIPMLVDVMPEAMSETLGLSAERNSNIELLNITRDMHGMPMLDGSVFDVKPQIEATIKSFQSDPRRNFRDQQDVVQPPPPAGAEQPPPEGPPQ